jgi:hypothetical protein
MASTARVSESAREVKAPEVDQCIASSRQEIKEQVKSIAKANGNGYESGID